MLCCPWCAFILAQVVIMSHLYEPTLGYGNFGNSAIYVKKTGDAMTGDLDMRSNRIVGLSPGNTTASAVSLAQSMPVVHNVVTQNFNVPSLQHFVNMVYVIVAANISNPIVTLPSAATSFVGTVFTVAFLNPDSSSVNTVNFVNPVVGGPSASFSKVVKSSMTFILTFQSGLPNFVALPEPQPTGSAVASFPRVQYISSVNQMTVGTFTLDASSPVPLTFVVVSKDILNSVIVAMPDPPVSYLNAQFEVIFNNRNVNSETNPDWNTLQFKQLFSSGFGYNDVLSSPGMSFTLIVRSSNGIAYYEILKSQARLPQTFSTKNLGVTNFTTGSRLMVPISGGTIEQNTFMTPTLVASTLGTGFFRNSHPSIYTFSVRGKIRLPSVTLPSSFTLRLELEYLSNTNPRITTVYPMNTISGNFALTQAVVPFAGSIETFLEDDAIAGIFYSIFVTGAAQPYQIDIDNFSITRPANAAKLPDSLGGF
jgi:hypothetical protein